MSDDNNVVPIRKQDIFRANPAMPDKIFDRLQTLGADVVSHLERLVSDPRFAFYSVKDQMKVIDAVMLRAYGQPDGSVRRNVNLNMNEEVSIPENDPKANVIRELSTRALQDQLPEFNRPTRRGRLRHQVVDAVVVKRED